mmetsp:Transcript_14292/g.30297  ORF Transcript_14292/g.30297 Transcript_14292/m.30297 type:complete len:218 (+) Transcript_14292:834-1487(+)
MAKSAFDVPSPNQKHQPVPPIVTRRQRLQWRSLAREVLLLREEALGPCNCPKTRCWLLPLFETSRARRIEPRNQCWWEHPLFDTASKRRPMRPGLFHANPRERRACRSLDRNQHRPLDRLGYRYRHEPLLHPRRLARRSRRRRRPSSLVLHRPYSGMPVDRGAKPFPQPARSRRCRDFRRRCAPQKRGPGRVFWPDPELGEIPRQQSVAATRPDQFR